MSDEQSTVLRTLGTEDVLEHMEPEQLHRAATLVEVAARGKSDLLRAMRRECLLLEDEIAEYESDRIAIQNELERRKTP